MNGWKKAEKEKNGSYERKTLLHNNALKQRTLKIRYVLIRVPSL